MFEIYIMQILHRLSVLNALVTKYSHLGDVALSPLLRISLFFLYNSFHMVVHESVPLIVELLSLHFRLAAKIHKILHLTNFVEYLHA
jgi:hypothetical protein